MSEIGSNSNRNQWETFPTANRLRVILKDVIAFHGTMAMAGNLAGVVIALVEDHIFIVGALAFDCSLVLGDSGGKPSLAWFVGDHRHSRATATLLLVVINVQLALLLGKSS